MMRELDKGCTRKGSCGSHRTCEGAGSRRGSSVEDKEDNRELFMEF